MTITPKVTVPLMTISPEMIGLKIANATTEQAIFIAEVICIFCDPKYAPLAQGLSAGTHHIRFSKSGRPVVMRDFERS